MSSSGPRLSVQLYVGWFPAEQLMTIFVAERRSATAVEGPNEVKQPWQWETALACGTEFMLGGGKCKQLLMLCISGGKEP